MTEKDAADLRFGLELGVDFVALSFVQTADDVMRAQRVMTEAGRSAPIIAKIERPAAVENLDAILNAAQGVMVARGDLGLEMPLEQVPRVQKRLSARARALGRPVISQPRCSSRCAKGRGPRGPRSAMQPTRSTRVPTPSCSPEKPPRAPIRSARCETLGAIIEDAELMPSSERVVLSVDPIGSRHGRALCEAAVTLSTTGEAAAIIAVTREGKTARLLSALRPAAAFTRRPETNASAARSGCGAASCPS